MTASLDVERKSLDATISDAGDSAEKPYGGFVAIASTPSLDRDGDRLGSDEWLELPDHITIDSDHGMSVSTTIGSARPYFDDEGRLMIDAAFSSIDRAQEVRTLIKEGHIRTVSVAFMTDRSKKEGTPRRELLNVGVVAIPSNRDAVILDSKAAKPEESVSDAAVKFLKAVEVAVKAGAGSGDTALVQAIHDAAVHLGAKCVAGDDEAAELDEESSESEGAKSAEMTVGVMIDGVVFSNEAPVVDPAVKTAFTLEQFKAALDVITSGVDSDAGEPQEGVSPADVPAEEAAAATDEVPAPADDAAVSADESEVAASEKRAARLAMALFATEVLSD